MFPQRLKWLSARAGSEPGNLTPDPTLNSAVSDPFWNTAEFKYIKNIYML